MAAAVRAEPDRQPFAVIVESALFGRRIAVRVEPATCQASYREFPSHDAAMAFAEQVSCVAGWPIRDTTGVGA